MSIPHSPEAEAILANVTTNCLAKYKETRFTCERLWPKSESDNVQSEWAYGVVARKEAAIAVAADETHSEDVRAYATKIANWAISHEAEHYVECEKQWAADPSLRDHPVDAATAQRRALRARNDAAAESKEFNNLATCFAEPEDVVSVARASIFLKNRARISEQIAGICDAKAARAISGDETPPDEPDEYELERRRLALERVAFKFSKNTRYCADR